jgi:hypothetical protein
VPGLPVILTANAVLLTGLVLVCILDAALALVVPKLFGPIPGLCTLVVAGPVAGLLYQSTFRRSLTATRASSVVYALGAVFFALAGLGGLTETLAEGKAAGGGMPWRLPAAVAAVGAWCALSWLKSVQWAGDLYAYEQSCDLEGPPVARDTREGAGEGQRPRAQAGPAAEMPKDLETPGHMSG